MNRADAIAWLTIALDLEKTGEAPDDALPILAEILKSQGTTGGSGANPDRIFATFFWELTTVALDLLHLIQEDAAAGVTSETILQTLALASEPDLYGNEE